MLHFLLLNEIKDKVVPPPNWLDSAVKILGIIGALIAAYKAIDEMKANRLQRERDYRWKQTNAAKQLMDEMMKDKLALDAMSMIDWDGNIYTDGAKTFKISHDEVRESLRIVDLHFSDKEKFIRDVFDKFLNYVEFTEQFITNDLFKYEDVIYPMEYYIKTAGRNDILKTLMAYIEEYLLRIH